MNWKYWLALLLFVGMIVSAWRGVQIARDLAQWEIRAEQASKRNLEMLEVVDSVSRQNDRLSEELQAGESYRLQLVSEAERLGGVIARLRGAVPQVPSQVPDSCLPWANRAKALNLLADTLTHRVGVDSLRIVSLASDLSRADSGRLLAVASLSRVANQLRVSDSLLNHFPRIVKPWLSLKLDTRTDFRSVTAVAALEHSGWYAGVGVDEKVRRSIVVGWGKSVRVF